MRARRLVLPRRSPRVELIARPTSRARRSFLWIGFLLRVLTFIGNEYYAISLVHEGYAATAAAEAAPDSSPAIENMPGGSPIHVIR